MKIRQAKKIDKQVYSGNGRCRLSTFEKAMKRLYPCSQQELDYRRTAFGVIKHLSASPEFHVMQPANLQFNPPIFFPY